MGESVPDCTECLSSPSLPCSSPALWSGRTPEYLGKKIEAYEMKMSTLAVLIPVLVVLLGTAVAVLFRQGTSSVLNPGPHGFSEILYAFSSAGNNNGSAFAGLNANTVFYNTALGFAMLFSRYWLAIPTLAIAGSLVLEKEGSVQFRHAGNPHAAVYFMADCGGRYLRRPELFAGPGPGADCGAFAAFLIKERLPVRLPVAPLGRYCLNGSRANRLTAWQQED